MMLTQLAAVARRTGYPVIEVKGWKARGRPGGMRGVRTITAHHTANGGAKGNYPSLRVVRDGRPGLPGPLAQYGLGVDGTIYVIAAGKSNHAGVSRSTGYTNSYAIGIEAEAVGVPGTKRDWPAAQMDAYARLCAALVDEFDLSVADVRGHKETCSPAGRKSDPSFSMPAFRSRVAETNLKKEIDDMSAADVKAIKAAIPTTGEIVAALRPVIKAEAVAAATAAVKAWQHQVVDLGTFAGAALPGADGNPTTQHTAGNLLEYAAGHAAETHRLTEDLAGKVAQVLDRLPATP